MQIYNYNNKNVKHKVSNLKVFTRLVPYLTKNINIYLFLARPTGSFRVGEYGTLLKRFCEGERECYLKLMGDTLRPFVPAYHGVVQLDGQDYNMMDNLLTHFSTPAVMDCKLGSR